MILHIADEYGFDILEQEGGIRIFPGCVETKNGIEGRGTHIDRFDDGYSVGVPSGQDYRWGQNFIFTEYEL